MKRNSNRDVPVFFFNSSEEDREAFRFIVDSGISCDFSAAADKPTPLLLVGYQRFVGLEEIKKYISEHSQEGRFQAT